MTKRIISCMLALMLLLALLPTAALAEADPAVAAIAGAEYQSLDEAVVAATSGDTITLLADCETETGLNLTKDLTIDGGDAQHKITFKTFGIALHGNLTFKNCKVEMTGISSTPGENKWATVCAWGNSSITLDHTDMTMDGTGTESDSQLDAHAIYFDPNSASTSALNLTNQAKLEIRNYKQDALEWNGGTAAYFFNLEKDSTYISDNNRSGLTGTFTVKATDSTIEVMNSTGNGSNGSHFELIRSNVTFNDNHAHGLSAVNLTIEHSKVQANRNGANGISVGGKLEIKDGSEVTISDNRCTAYSQWAIPGALSIAGTSSIADSTVTITNNLGSGICQKRGSLTVDPSAALTITNNYAQTRTYTHSTTKIEYTHHGYGGGIYASGTVSLPESVMLYNNHAEEAGDDIYNNANGAGDEYYTNTEGSSITFGAVGSGWVLDDCNHRIDGWYYDGDPDYLDDEGAAKRWIAHDTDEPFTEEFKLDATVTVDTERALKAAHGPKAAEDTPDNILPILLAAKWLNTQDHHSYLIGYPDGTARPDGKITRAEVATIFFRLLTDDARARNWSSENDYYDVPADKWYNNAISTLSRMGVISGYSDGTFRPDAPISRAEFAKIAVNFTQNTGSDANPYFTDVKTTDWFAPYVTAAKEQGLIEGYADGSFRPEQPITRAEVCAIVNRTLGRKPSKDLMKISDRINWPDVKTTDWFYADMMEATNSHTYQMGRLVETWTDKLLQRDWTALEAGWADAYAGRGGEVH